MVNLKHLFKEYNCNLDIKLLKKVKNKISTNETVDFDANNFQDLNWPDEFLPHPFDFSPEVLERLFKVDISTEKDKKIVKVLTAIDLMLIKAVKAEDLISYEGTPSSLAISHILNKNSALQLLISRKFSKQRIFSMLKYAHEYKNYNLICVLIKSLQSMKLSARRIEKLVIYKEILEKQENGIFPFDWMLQDCEDSNLNISSEVASMRFCKIVEKLKEMKRLTNDFVVSDKSIQTVFIEMWKAVKTSHWTYNSGKNESETNLFLIL